MMREEFEKRTGFYPTSEEYAAIEKAYMDFDGDKDAFCKAYKKNLNGMAERIQRELDMAAFRAQREHAAQLARKDEEADRLKAEIERLKKELDREQEWRDYEDDKNVTQTEYRELAESSGTEKLSEEKAKQIIARDFGFDPARITIRYDVPVYQINRHRKLRIVGATTRLPLYNASDWNYIRFDCASMSWEMYNGELRPFLH